MNIFSGYLHLGGKLEIYQVLIVSSGYDYIKLSF